MTTQNTRATTDNLTSLKKDIQAYTRACTGKNSEREQLHNLLCRASDLFAKDWNTEGFTSIIHAENAIRANRQAPVLQWIYLATCGAVMVSNPDGQGNSLQMQGDNGLVVFSAKEQVFKVRKLSGVLTQEERTKAQAKRVQALADAGKTAKQTPWYSLTPAKANLPYKFSSFLSALSKAIDNADALTAKENLFIRDIMTTVQTHKIELKGKTPNHDNLTLASASDNRVNHVA